MQFEIVMLKIKVVSQVVKAICGFNVLLCIWMLIVIDQKES